MRTTKYKILSLLVMGIFIMSIFGHSAQVSGQQQIETNFELSLVTQAGSRIRESYAFFIKQSLAPLGIDVDIQSKPFGQFVGDLLHISTGTPYDLAIVGFAGGGFVPDFRWKFHSSFTHSTFGPLMYQLNHPDVQRRIQQTTPSNINHTAEVDPLLLSIDFELDMLERQQKIFNFTEMYMQELLYDFPLTTITDRLSMWKGYGDDQNSNTCPEDPLGNEVCDNDLWKVQEGIFNSRKLGAKWQASTPSGRDANNSHLQFRTATPGSYTLDPLAVFDTATGDISGPLTEGLLAFDGSSAPHPNVAYNYAVDDWSYNSTHNVSDGKWTFLINADGNDDDSVGDWKFPAAPAHANDDETSFSEEVVDANDFLFTLKIYKLANLIGMNINGASQYEPLENAEVSTTVTQDDTLTVYLNRTTPNDITTYGAVDALPEHILNDTLHFTNSSGTFTFQTFNGIPVFDRSFNFTEYSMNNEIFDPQTSDEWEFWAQPPLETSEGTQETGNSMVGEFQLERISRIDGFWSFSAREDYPMPNEEDAQLMYNKHTSALENVDGFNMSYFAPHAFDSAQDPYYWAFDSNDTLGAKPANQQITTMSQTIIDDTNAALIKFEAGEIDVFAPTALGASTVRDHVNNPDFVVKSSIPLAGPQLLVFGLKAGQPTSHSRIRYAIASAIDKQEMIKINDGFATPHHSPVWRVFDLYKPPAFAGSDGQLGTSDDLSWYTDQYKVPYDYATARDIMRSLGYSAYDDPAQGGSPPEAPTGRVISTLAGLVGSLGSNAWFGLSAIAVTSVVLVRRYKKH